LNTVVVFEEFVFYGVFREYGDIDRFGFCYKLPLRNHSGAVTPGAEQERTNKHAGNVYSFHVELAFVDGERAIVDKQSKKTLFKAVSITLLGPWILAPPSGNTIRSQGCLDYVLLDSICLPLALRGTMSPFRGQACYTLSDSQFPPSGLTHNPHLYFRVPIYWVRNPKNDFSLRLK
jgi:hypothetical protein